MAKKTIETPVVTPKAVARPTQKATTDFYSQAWRNSYDKKAEIPKPIIFELTDHSRDAKGNKTWPISCFFEAQEIIYDSESNKRIEIRFCKNESTIIKDKQQSFSKSEIIRFQNGVVIVMPNNPSLLEYMRKSSLNASNPNRIGDTRPAFKELMPAVKAKVNIADEIVQLDAVSLALRAPIDKMMPVAKYLNIDTTRSIAEIRHDLKGLAQSNPSSFVSLFDNKEVMLKGTVKTAQEYSILTVTSDNIAWADGSKITGVPIGKDPYQALVDYLKEKNEFDKFKSTLEHKLNVIINS